MLTLEEAKIKMARLMLAEADAHAVTCPNGPVEAGPCPAEPDSESYREAKWAKQRFAFECAAMPSLAGQFRPWMIDICGSFDACPTSKQIENAVDGPESIAALVDDIGGNLAVAVREACEVDGFRITDRGGGCGGWHLGIPCTDRQADELCGMLWRRFGKAIDAGLLSVQKKFWGWKFPGIANWDEAKAFLNESGLE